MFVDLNIPLPDSALNNPNKVKQSDWVALKDKILRAKQLGYRVIALNQTIASKPTPDILNVWQHVPTIDDAYTSWSSSSSLDLATCLKSSRSLIILRRLTVELADHAQNYSLNNLSSLLNAYDLIAIRPTSEKVFHAVCSGTYPSIDLISLDLGSRLPFYLKMKTVLMAVEKGFSFEICYGHAITDSSARRHWISNAASLVRASRGRSLVISSGADAAFDLRAPYDLTNLGTITGMNPALSKHCLSINPRAVLYHADTRRFSQKSIVGVLPSSTSPIDHDQSSAKRTASPTATNVSPKRAKSSA